jgi:hypothetical protein
VQQCKSAEAQRSSSLIISSIPEAVTAPILDANQNRTQTLVFQAQSKFSCFCYGKMCFVSFILRYKGVGISVTSNITFFQ